jgi:hypothetical protein
MPPCKQVTGQRDGARLLVTLESKQADAVLDAAAQRFQQLLQPAAVVGVQRDVSRLSGQSGHVGGSRCSSGMPSPQRVSSDQRAVAGGGGGGRASSERSRLPPPAMLAVPRVVTVGQQQECVVSQAAAVLAQQSDDG